MRRDRERNRNYKQRKDTRKMKRNDQTEQGGKSHKNKCSMHNARGGIIGKERRLSFTFENITA